MTNGKKAVLSAVVCMSLLGAACDNPASSSDSDSESHYNSAQFYVNDPTSHFGAHEAASYYTITAHQMAVGQKCEIWVESGAAVSESDAQAIAAEYDNVIYPAMKNAFGFQIDGINIMEAGDFVTNNDGKLLLLLLDIRDNYSSSSDPYLAGFFNPYDLLSFSRSNMADIIYLDIYPGRIKTDGFYATIAHELQHLIQFVADIGKRNSGNGGLLRQQDIWINEGLSAAAEYVYLNSKYNSAVSHNKAGRVQDYNTLPAISAGNTFFVWNNDLADYATVYLFFQWLRIHGSPQIYKDILEKPQQDNGSDLDYRVVQNAAGQHFGSNASYAGDWETLLRSWFAANCINAPSNHTNNIFGYKGELTVVPRAARTGTPGSATNFPLKPGEGVYSKLTASQTPGASGSIKHAGLNVSSSAVSTSGPYSSGDWLLTFNSNSNNSDSAENGTVYVSASMALPPAAMRAALDAADGEPRRVGITDRLRAGLHSVPLVDARGRRLTGFLRESGEQE